MTNQQALDLTGVAMGGSPTACNDALAIIREWKGRPLHAVGDLWRAGLLGEMQKPHMDVALDYWRQNFGDDSPLSVWVRYANPNGLRKSVDGGVVSWSRTTMVRKVWGSADTGEGPFAFRLGARLVVRWHRSLMPDSVFRRHDTDVRAFPLVAGPCSTGLCRGELFHLPAPTYARLDAVTGGAIAEAFGNLRTELTTQDQRDIWQGWIDRFERARVALLDGVQP